jgi:hypothetical protein
MPMLITPDSAWGKELTRWNTPRNQFVRTTDDQIALDVNGQPMKGMNAIGYEPYPKMLYKAQVLPNGKASVGQTPPHPMYMEPAEYERQCLFLETFNRSCQKVVHSEAEDLLAQGQGWRASQPDALALYEQQQQELAQAAAEATHAAQRMSAKAQAEFAIAEDATHVHVADVPAPRRRPRRPRTPPMDPVITEPPAVVDDLEVDPAPVLRTPRELVVVAEPEPDPKPFASKRRPGRPRKPR